jgi:hypothetical protein
MATFRRTRSGVLSLDLKPVEADVLASLAREVIELLDVPVRTLDPLAVQLGLTDLSDADGTVGPTAPPEDEVLRRLLPDAYAATEGEAASEFRRLTERSLRERKATAARTLLDTLERVQLDADGARTWLTALNDIRLALGTRLGVSEDRDADDLPADDPDRYAWAVYDFTTHLQRRSSAPSADAAGQRRDGGARA